MAHHWPDGVDLIELDQVDSTNEEARRRAAALTRSTWIRADRQVKGKGRQGRVWGEGRGALYATLFLRPDLSPGEAAQLSFALALSVAELAEHAGLSPRLKWPNDVLVNGCKLSGVLLESGAAGHRLDWLAAGVGVNLTDHPPGDPEAAHPPTDITAEGGAALTPLEALTVVAARFEHWRAIHAAHGFAPLREAWLSRAHGLGARVTARTPRETVAGLFEDMDEAGALVLNTGARRRLIHAADVHFG